MGDTVAMHCLLSDDRQIGVFDFQQPALLHSDSARTAQLEPPKVGESFDAISYLFPRTTDYLIRNKGDGKVEKVYADCLNGKKYAIICTAYLPLDNGGSSDLSHFLFDVVPELLADHKHDFDVVFVVRMEYVSDDPYCRNALQEAFTDFFSEFPMSILAVPILEYGRANNLLGAMGFSDYPSPASIIVDLEEGQVTNSSFCTFGYLGANFYPFTKERKQELCQERDEILRGRVSLATLLRPHSSDVVLGCVRHGRSCSKQSLSSLTNKVLGLYVLNDGTSMDTVCDMYKLCKDNNLQFEVVVVCAKRSPLTVPSWEAHVDSLLQNSDCCGWLWLPFKDMVIRRLNFLCWNHGGDKLVIVGPNASYVDIDGADVFLEYGIGAYPFTKQAVWDNHVARVRSFSLQELFTTVEINHLISPDGQNVPVSCLRDANVLLYFTDAPCPDIVDKEDWYAQLFKWFYELKKSAGETRFEMICVCFGCDPDDDCPCRRSERPWLSVTGEKSVALYEKLFDELALYLDTLVAFGSDGRVRSLVLQDTLENQSGPATFPKSDGSLRMEVAMLLKSNPLDHWFRNFKPTDN